MADLEALYRQLETGTDRAATLDVLADLLVEQGDPRGELIQVQRRLATAVASPETHALRDREAELVSHVRFQLLGPLAPRPEIVLDFVDGLLHRVVLVEAADPYPVGETLATILASRDARFLHTIVLDPTEAHTHLKRPIGGVLERLEGVPMPASLRRVELGRAFSRDAGYRVYRDWGDCGFEDDLSALLDVFPDIAELRVDLGAAALTWQPLVSSRLVELAYVAPYVRPEELVALGASELPALETCELWTGGQFVVNEESDLYDDGFEDDDLDEEDEEDVVEDHEYLETVDVDALAPVLAMLERTRVTRLTIANFAYDSGSLVEAIAGHAFARRLVQLDVSWASSRAGLDQARGLLGATEVVAAMRDAAAGQVAAYRYVITQE